MDTVEIIPNLLDAPSGVARQVPEYEQRQEVISAAEARVAA